MEKRNRGFETSFKKSESSEQYEYSSLKFFEEFLGLVKYNTQLKSVDTCKNTMRLEENIFVSSYIIINTFQTKCVHLG